MNSIKVRKEELLKRIEENRDNHATAVEEARGNYREAVIAELDAMLNEARAGKRIRRAVSLIEPQDHTSDYDRVIDMLKMSTEDVIELDTHDFARYVRDEWEWFQQFSASNMRYATSRDTIAYLGKSV